MKKRILIAPLNWGLGHAARCIPIIHALVEHNFVPVIASDGAALTLLRKEFPNLSSIELPSYNITYAKNGAFFKLKLLKDSPKLIAAIKEEKKAISRILEHNDIAGIISDNRLGVRHKKVPSIFITHQLNVLSGSTSWLSTKMHQKFIKKFNICWVPDVEGNVNLSGKLGHVKSFEVPVNYIGPLSRFSMSTPIIKNNLMVLISGPEPQRNLLEEKLFQEFKNYPGKVIFVKGLMEKAQTIQVLGNMTIYNFMTSGLLEKTKNERALKKSSYGYTKIMEKEKNKKKKKNIKKKLKYEK